MTHKCMLRYRVKLVTIMVYEKIEYFRLRSDVEIYRPDFERVLLLTIFFYITLCSHDSLLKAESVTKY